VQGIPNWRHLDLLGRLEVKQLIVQSARGIKLLLEEGAADWQDIRIKTRQELVRAQLDVCTGTYSNL